MDNINASDVGYEDGSAAYEGFSVEQQTQFDGTRAKVASVKIEPRPIKFDDEGKPLAPGVKLEGPAMIVRTVPIAKNSAGVELCAEEAFYLKKSKITGKWIVSKNEKSNSYKFLKKYNINRIEEIAMAGRDVILSKKVRQNGTTYLGISFG